MTTTNSAEALTSELSTNPVLTTALTANARGPVLVAAALVAGLQAGTYFTWATGVMPGLAKVDDRTFVHAMQQMNIAIVNPVFIATFLGAPVLAGASIAVAGSHARPWAIAATVLAVGTLVITFAGNIPLNDALDAAGPVDKIKDLAAVRAELRVALGQAQHRADASPRPARWVPSRWRPSRLAASTLPPIRLNAAAADTRSERRRIVEGQVSPAARRTARSATACSSVRASYDQKSRSHSAVSPTPATQAMPPLVIAPRTDHRSAVTPARTWPPSGPTE